jgi:hypothetical protein
VVTGGQAPTETNILVIFDARHCVFKAISEKILSVKGLLFSYQLDTILIFKSYNTQLTQYCSNYAYLPVHVHGHVYVHVNVA